MNILFHLGRVLLVAIFIWSGIGKLTDLDATAQMITSQVPLPEWLSGLGTELESAVGMSTPRLLALLAGLVEVGAGLLIAFGIGTRAAAVVLLLYTVVSTVCFHDFWTMTGPERANNMIHAFKNLSLIGGFLILLVLGPWRPEPRMRVDRSG